MRGLKDEASNPNTKETGPSKILLGWAGMEREEPVCCGGADPCQHGLWKPRILYNTMLEGPAYHPFGTFSY